MNYQNIIQPIDFSALYQLAFTLYAAFIAIEYAKSYTAQVINHFYNFKAEITIKLTENLKLCRNEEMQSIDSDDYFREGDGLCLVDDYNEKYKLCKTNAENKKDELNKKVDKNTEYRIFRHISIFMILFNFTLLLTGGLYRIYPTQVIHFLLTFTILSLIFIIMGWLFAILRITQSWTERKSIIWVVVLFCVFNVLSFLSLLLHFSWDVEIKEWLWTGGVFFAVLLPYLNFVFFFLLVTIQMSKIRVYCEASYKSLSLECEEVGELMEKILNHQEMRNKIDEHKKELGNDVIPQDSQEKNADES